MKILLLADEPDVRLWDHLDRRILEDIELVISCGDLPGEYLSFITCFTNAPILYVHGNHDDRYSKRPPEGCICIEDKIVQFRGLRILGLGGCMRYKPGPHMYTEKEMLKRVKDLRFRLWRSKGFDILVAHAPILDVGDENDLAHRGFAVFRKLVDKYRPALFVHGHVHKNYTYQFKRERQCGETRVINAWTSYIIDLPEPENPIRLRKKDQVL